jgi:CRP-like cAMP-binding protein
MSLVEALAALPPFDRLDPAGRRAALREASEVSLRAGRALCCQGDRAERCWLLVVGTVRGVMYRSDETTVELGRAGPGDWLGLAETLLGTAYLADQVAEGHCLLAGFGRVGLGRLLEVAGMRASLLDELARRYCTLHARIELVQPIDRLARFLLDHAAGDATVAGTQEAIAEAIGATRETVNRNLQRLQDEGLVKVSRGAVTVLDAGRLAARGAQAG